MVRMVEVHLHKGRRTGTWSDRLKLGKESLSGGQDRGNWEWAKQAYE